MEETAKTESIEARDYRLMGEALEHLKTEPDSEVPVAAVIVCGDEIVGRGINRRGLDNDPTAHAEIVALREAAANLKRWNLSDCELYVTLEPCAMCAGAVVYSRIKRVVFGAYDVRFGACGSALDVARCEKLNHRAEVVGGVRKDECLKPISDFFKTKRAKRGNAE